MQSLLFPKDKSKEVDDSQFEYEPLGCKMKWGFPFLAKVTVGSRS